MKQQPVRSQETLGSSPGRYEFFRIFSKFPRFFTECRILFSHHHEVNIIAIFVLSVDIFVCLFSFEAHSYRFLVKVCCENSLPPAVEQDAAARPQPLLLGRTRGSQSNKLNHRKTQWQPRGCPTDHTRCRTKKPETQRTTAQRLSANLAVNVVTPQLTSKNNIEPQTDVARHSLRVQSFVKVSRSHTF